MVCVGVGNQIMNIKNAEINKSSLSAFRFLFFALLFLLPLSSLYAASTELGAEDDLTVLGTDGTVTDPDLEIKGFSIFGSTNVLTHISTAAGNTVFNGAIETSSDIYVVGKSTFIDNVYFSGAENIFINGGSDSQILKYNLGGYLEWVNISSLGDNFWRSMSVFSAKK